MSEFPLRHSPLSLPSGEASSARDGGGQDLAGALHEVSNALTVVLGWLAEARSLTDSPDSQRALAIAYQHAKRGHAVARQAIGAPVEDGSTTRSATSVAEDAQAAVSPEAARRGVTVELQRGAADPLIAASGTALQILVNLLLNALAFAPGGSVVTLGVDHRAEGVVFRVQDQGSGVPEHMRETLFSSSQSLRPGGAGIGLPHSHALASREGGSLTLVGARGAAGACFELSWPVSDEPSQTASRQPSSPASSIAGMRVLVLEDDEAVLSMVQFGLESRGVEVVGIRTGKELQSLYDPEPFDAVLVDLSPIKSDPKRALEAFQERNGQVPIILISGTAVRQAADLPLSGWVEKPFELGDLYRALASLRQASERNARASSIPVGARG